MADRYIARRDVRVNGRNYTRGQEVPATHNMGVLIDSGAVRCETVEDVPAVAPVVTPPVKAEPVSEAVVEPPAKPARRRRNAGTESAD